MDLAHLDAFESERSRLLGVAYRLTGSVVDAEDAVQEAWLRLERVSTGSTTGGGWTDQGGSSDERGEIRNIQAWLTTTVSRLCLDRLTSAAARRETYVGQWLPEPVTAPLGATDDPLAAVVRHEDNRFAALVVLDVLPPAQRVAFVLHDAFAVPFDEIAATLGVSTASARQLASRARRAVADPSPAVADSEHDEAVKRLLAAMATGDLQAVVFALHPDAYVMGDANGTTSTAVNVIRGREKVARFYLGLLARFGSAAIEAFQPVRVNGQLGLMTSGWSGESRRLSSPARVSAFAVRDGLVLAVFDVANPDKLAGARTFEP